MLRARLAIGIPLTAVLVLILVLDTRFFDPWFPLWLASMLAVMGLAAREVAVLLEATDARPSRGVVIGGVLAIVASNWAPHVASDQIGGDSMAGGAVSALAWPLWTFAAVVMSSFLYQSARFEHPGGTMATIAGTVLAVSYVGLLGSFLIQFRWLDGPYRGLVPLGALLATAKGADIGAYSLGRLFGRRKLWPRLSPNKTVEGTLGGACFGVLGAALVFSFAHHVLGTPRIGWLTIVGFGLAVGTAAQLGDLMESMLKRDCAQKDASAALPGFGGVLDVLDSLLFAGPVAYAYWLLFGPS